MLPGIVLQRMETKEREEKKTSTFFSLKIQVKMFNFFKTK
jgi:hypothetical protein